MSQISEVSPHFIISIGRQSDYHKSRQIWLSLLQEIGEAASRSLILMGSRLITAKCLGSLTLTRRMIFSSECSDTDIPDAGRGWRHATSRRHATVVFQLLHVSTFAVFFAAHMGWEGQRCIITATAISRGRVRGRATTGIILLHPKVTIRDHFPKPRELIDGSIIEEPNKDTVDCLSSNWLPGLWTGLLFRTGPKANMP